MESDHIIGQQVIIYFHYYNGNPKNISRTITKIIYRSYLLFKVSIVKQSLILKNDEKNFK